MYWPRRFITSSEITLLKPLWANWIRVIVSYHVPLRIIFIVSFTSRSLESALSFRLPNKIFLISLFVNQLKCLVLMLFIGESIILQDTLLVTTDKKWSLIHLMTFDVDFQYHISTKYIQHFRRWNMWTYGRMDWGDRTSFHSHLCRNTQVNENRSGSNFGSSV